MSLEPDTAHTTLQDSRDARRQACQTYALTLKDRWQ